MVLNAQTWFTIKGKNVTVMYAWMCGLASPRVISASDVNDAVILTIL